MEDSSGGHRMGPTYLCKCDKGDNDKISSGFRGPRGTLVPRVSFLYAKHIQAKSDAPGGLNNIYNCNTDIKKLKCLRRHR